MAKIVNEFNKTPKRRLNIAFFVDWIDRGYQLTLMQGLIDSARRHDVNLFCLEGGCLNGQKAESDRNRMYQLIREQKVDGLLILASPIGYMVYGECLAQFCRSFAPLPTISIGAQIDGCNSVIVDNRIGFRAALVHLIEVHHYRKFAFIGGPKANQDAIIRYQVFEEVLAEYNIPLDPNLVVEGNFCRDSGSEAVKTLLDVRNAAFDVIVAANDDMALGALNELHARNLDVPGQVALIGFDDSKACTYADPPLTTVNESIYEQGVKSLDWLLEMIANRPVPSKLYIPSRFVLRQSCGCLPQTALQCTYGDTIAEAPAVSTFFNNQAQIVGNIVEQSRYLFRECTDRDLAKMVADLIGIFSRQVLKGETSEPVLKTFNRIMSKPQFHLVEIPLWQDFLSILRREILPYLDNRNQLRADDLFHQLRLLISEKAISQEKRSNYQALTQHYIINNLTKLLLSTNNVSQVLATLNKYLPQLGISTGYLSEYNIVKKRYRYLMAYNSQGTIEFKAKDAVSGNWVPEVIAGDGQTHVLLMTMVYSSNHKIYILALELDRQISEIFETLRGIIASSIAGVMLNEKLHRQQKNLISEREHLKNLTALRNAMYGFVQTILAMIEVRDPYTAGHQSRVSELACAIAQEMHLSHEVIEGLRVAGSIHDLGKIAVPFEVLNKPGRLKATEFALIKEHPVVAYEILKRMEFAWPIAQIVVQHHERLDGSGYPLGISGQEILVEARILAVADVIEAMATHRPYRVALGIEKALEEIKLNRGKLYDCQVVDTCLDLFKYKGYHLGDNYGNY